MLVAVPVATVGKNGGRTTRVDRKTSTIRIQTHSFKLLLATLAFWDEVSAMDICAAVSLYHIFNPWPTSNFVGLTRRAYPFLPPSRTVSNPRARRFLHAKDLPLRR